MRRRVAIGAVILLSAVSACRAGRPAAQAGSTTETYVPGLGEIMTLQQMRHVKLWFAGEAGNWDLASYELKELQEGFDDVVKFHATHEESPVAPRDAVPRMMNGPLSDLRAAVEHKDAPTFSSAYDKLTEACNGCHVATNFGFNRVQRPATNPYPSQVFAVATAR
jgi:hypothetical protein